MRPASGVFAARGGASMSPVGRFLSLLDWMGAQAIQRLTLMSSLFALFYGAFKSFLVEGYRGRGVVLRILANQIRFTGLDATYRLCLTGLTLGMVVIFQATTLVPGLSTGGLVDRAIGMFLVREISPLIIALILIGRSGTAIATELAAMKLNKEIEALEAMGINILHYIVFPRLVGFILSFVVLLIYFTVAAVYGGYWVLRFLGLVPLSFDVDQVFLSLSTWDLFLTVLKAVVFGAMISLVSIHHGLSVKISFREVPQAATKAVVFSIVICFTLNSLISVFL